MKRTEYQRKNNRMETQRQQAHPKAGAVYSPRGLYRGLKVPYSSQPGKKRIYPKQGK